MNVEKYINEDKLNELKQLAEEMKYEYFTNPSYWSNNKRRMHGIPMRRKGGRKKKSFYQLLISKRRFYGLLEEMIDEVISNSLKDTEWFNTFVDVNDMTCGDHYNISNSNNEYRVCKYGNFKLDLKRKV